MKKIDREAWNTRLSCPIRSAKGVPAIVGTSQADFVTRQEDWAMSILGLDRFVFLGAVLLASGCTTLQGMPEQTVTSPPPPFTTQNVAKIAPQSGSVPASPDRNEWIEKNLIAVDTAYDTFVVGLQKSRAGWGIGAGILDLAFGVASSLTPSAGVKANYAAASTLLTGSYAVINKEAFYEKTVNALVAAMDARRKDALVPLRKGMQLQLLAYPLSEAHEDMRAYQRASSLVGGLSFIETAAENKISEAEKAIEKLRPLNSVEDRMLRACVTDVLQSLSEAEHGTLLNVMKSIHGDFEDHPTVGELLSAVSNTRFNPDPAYDRKLLAALDSAGLVAKKCGS